MSTFNPSDWTLAPGQETNQPTQTTGLLAEINGAPVPKVPGLSGQDTVPNSQPTVNPDGTISTLTTGQPSQYLGNPGDAAKQVGEVYGQVGAGVAEPVLGAAKVAADATAGPINDVINYALNEKGIDLPQKEIDGAISSLSNYTKAYNKAHPNQMIHPSTIGNMAAYSLVPGGEGALAQGAIAGGLSFINSIGSNDSYDDAAKNAIIGAAITGAGSKILSRVFDGPINHQAKLLLKLNKGRISEAQAINMLKGIPRKDQVISLANSIDLAKNYFGAAVGDNSKLATALGAKLEAHQSILKPFVADAKEVEGAKAAYSDMVNNLNSKYPQALDPTQIQKQLNQKMLDVYSTDPTGLGTSLKKINSDISEPITPGNALDIVQNINGILRKPAIKKDFKTTKALTEVKNSLKSFMKQTISPEDAANSDVTIARYAETKNRQKLGDIIQANTKSNYATDYGKVLTDLKKEGLSGKNTDFVVPILKEMADKFANDKYLSNVITPNGKPKPLNTLGVWSAIIGKLYDMVSPLVNKSRYKDIQLRKAIIKSIKREDNKSPISFIDDLVKNKTITLPQVEKLKQEVPEAFTALEHKPDAPLTGDTNLEPKYVSSNGTVSNDASQAALHDAQTQLIRDNLSGNHSDAVINKVNALLNSKRIININKNVADRMKADDAQGNMKMLQKIIQSETDKIVGRINKDHGVKLPPKEVEKIYQMKLKDLMKDC